MDQVKGGIILSYYSCVYQNKKYKNRRKEKTIITK